MGKTLKITCDTNVWRSLGLKRIKALKDRLELKNKSAQVKIEIWDTAPSLFETVFDWIKDGRYNLAASFTKQKKDICENRMVPSPQTVIQRWISDAYGLPKADLNEELSIYLALREKMTDENFLKSEKFATDFFNPINLKREEYAKSMEKIAEISNEIGKKKENFDAVITSKEYNFELSKTLAEGFQLSSDIQSTMSYSFWIENQYTKKIVNYYNKRIEERLFAGRRAKPQDLLDLELLICGFRLDKFVTNNTKDFQKWGFLRSQLWTLEEFKKEI